MPGSDNFQVPLAALRDIERTLTSLQGDLDGVESGASHLEGADDIYGMEVTNAVEKYYNEWHGPRRRLLDNVGKLGEVSGKIAQITEDFDNESASGFNKFAAQLKGEG